MEQEVRLSQKSDAEKEHNELAESVKSSSDGELLSVAVKLLHCTVIYKTCMHHYLHVVISTHILQH